MTILIKTDVGRFHVKCNVKGSEGAGGKFTETSEAKERRDKTSIYCRIERGG
jgi:hypothetical protein